MQQNAEHNPAAESEDMLTNLAEALAEAEDWAAEVAREMRAEAHQAWREWNGFQGK